jgi:molybdopterin molybdotransferase
MLRPPAEQTVFEQAVLGEAMAENYVREDYVRARLDRDPNHRLVATPFETQDSAMLLALANADGLIRRRPHAPPAPKGTLIDVIVFDHFGSSF